MYEDCTLFVPLDGGEITGFISSFTFGKSAGILELDRAVEATAASATAAATAEEDSAVEATAEAVKAVDFRVTEIPE
jgi:hypothetical protein